MIPDYSALSQAIRSTIRRSPVAWAHACGIHLYPYQVPVANAIKHSIINHLGLTFVIIFPRQSGKNELQAHIFSWLLFRSALTGGRIVSVSPTFKPQTIINMGRVRESLDACVGSRGLWRSSSGYIYQLGLARLQFLSGEAHARVVGATASLLLSVDEAQEVSCAKFDKDFFPMTASTNATTAIWGIPWTGDTLLERERRIAMQEQHKDGLQRLFFYTADDVRKIIPAYGLHVDRVIAEHGRNHPRVRSQYFCETIDAQSGMFTPARLALIISPELPSPDGVLPSGEGLGVRPPSPDCAIPSGDREASWSEAKGGLGVRSSAVHGPSSFLIDVAGMDECAGQLQAATAPADGTSHRLSAMELNNPGRDSTALTIVEIDLSTLSTLNHPSYHVVARHSWIGENHLAVFGKIKSLADTWHPQHIVIDATGVGEGLWALLDRNFPSRVIPVKFTRQEKSELGWRFLSIIETGRFRDHVHTDEVRLQYSRCICEVLPGPQKTLRWGVPDGARGPDGGLIHDDFILADSLVARLDQLEWHLSSPTIIIPGRDPLLDQDHHFGDDDYDHFFGTCDNDHFFR
jgi:hypothetical protein